MNLHIGEMNELTHFHLLARAISPHSLHPVTPTPYIKPVHFAGSIILSPTLPSFFLFPPFSSLSSLHIAIHPPLTAMASAFSVSSLLNEQQQQMHDRSSRRPRPAVLDISNLLNNDMATPTLSPTRTPSPVSVSSGPAASSGYPFPPLPSIADTLPGMLPPLSSAYPSMPKPFEPDYHHAHHNSNSGGIGLWMHDSRASSVSSLASNASNCSSTTNETSSKSLSQQQQQQHHNHSSSSDEEEQVSSSKHQQQPVKAKRRRANAKQLEVLNRVFERTVFPSTQLRAELGRQLGMSPRTVQIWFQNRRQAIRTRERQRLLRIVRDDQQVSSPSSTSSSD